ncbi:MAG: cadmium resistance transporter [Natronomonas sp.]
MLSLVVIAVIAFVATNLDDLAVLTAFCGHERYRFREILLGQYLGFGLLVAVSLVGGVGVARFFTEHVRWLGILPIVVGAVWYLRTRDRTERAASDRPAVAGSASRSRTMVVAGVGVADGGDNIAVYIPLFAALGLDETILVAGIFLVAAGLWVLLARWLGSRQVVAARVEAYGDVVLPLVFVGLGVVILAGGI